MCVGVVETALVTEEIYIILKREKKKRNTFTSIIMCILLVVVLRLWLYYCYIWSCHTLVAAISSYRDCPKCSIVDQLLQCVNRYLRYSFFIRNTISWRNIPNTVSNSTATVCVLSLVLPTTIIRIFW